MKHGMVSSKPAEVGNAHYDRKSFGEDEFVGRVSGTDVLKKQVKYV